MKDVKRKKKSIFLRIALAAFSIYIVVMLVQLQLEINQRQNLINDLNNTIHKQTVENEDLQYQNDNYETYLEDKAREEGMARPGETIYKEVPGN